MRHGGLHRDDEINGGDKRGSLVVIIERFRPVLHRAPCHCGQFGTIAGAVAVLQINKNDASFFQ